MPNRIKTIIAVFLRILTLCVGGTMKEVCLVMASDILEKSSVDPWIQSIIYRIQKLFHLYFIKFEFKFLKLKYQLEPENSIWNQKIPFGNRKT